MNRLKEAEFPNTQFEVKSKGTSVTIGACVGGCQAGLIRYTQPKKESQPIKLGLLWVRGSYYRNGIGTQLVSEFVSTVGPGRNVSTRIDNEESLALLEALESEGMINKTAATRLTDPLLLATLPIVQIFELGSLKVQSITVQYDFKDTAYKASLEAVTN